MNEFSNIHSYTEQIYKLYKLYMRYNLHIATAWFSKFNLLNFQSNRSIMFHNISLT